MTTPPTIVQSAFSSSATSPQTVILGSVATAGNTLVMIVTGAKTAPTIPTGFTVFEADPGTSSTNEGTWTYVNNAIPSYTLPGTHRYWRIYITGNVFGSFACIAEVQFAASVGGSNLIGSGTPTASSVAGGMAATNAVDGNAATYWNAASSFPQWWEYDFGSGNAVQVLEVNMLPRADTPSTTPGTWSLQYSDDNSIWTIAQSFTSAPWTAGVYQNFTIAPQLYSVITSGQQNVALFEIANGGVNYSPAHGACGGSGTTSITTGSLQPALDQTNALRLFVMEWDNAETATTPGGWTLLSPSGWQGTGTHNCAIWSIPGSVSSIQTITMSAATTTPVWLDVQIGPDGETPVRVSQLGTETWMSNPNPPVRLTQFGAEAWITNPSSPVRVSQLGAEVWVNIALSMFPNLLVLS